MKNLSLALVALALVVGCDSNSTTTDSGTVRTDSGSTGDSGPGSDGGPATDGGGSDGGPAVDGGPAPAPTCEAYCTSIMANCTAANAQYASMESCMDVCTAFEVGTAADVSGNTLGCRVYHAGAAASTSEPATHCPHAGPAGAGPCGTNCESFCAIAESECPAVYESAAACMTECAGFPQGETDPMYGLTTTSGDSFACRLYHLTVAASDPATHCSHINEASLQCVAAE